MLKELQIRMIHECDRDSTIICAINGYEKSLWNETGPVEMTSAVMPDVGY
jgi:hypothetical protein